jgi:hypothetical protein
MDIRDKAFITVLRNVSASFVRQAGSFDRVNMLSSCSSSKHCSDQEGF